MLGQEILSSSQFFGVGENKLFIDGRQRLENLSSGMMILELEALGVEKSQKLNFLK